MPGKISSFSRRSYLSAFSSFVHPCQILPIMGSTPYSIALYCLIYSIIHAEVQHSRPIHQIGLGVEVAVPAVRLQALNLVIGQALAVADGHVPLDVADRAHARDHSGYRRVAEDVAQRHLRDLVLGDAELGDDGSHALVDLLLAAAAEVVVAEVVLVEGDLRRDPAGQRTFIERNPYDNADVVLPAGGKELVLWALVEDVIDHLHRVNYARLYEPHGVGRLVVVYGDAEEADLALPL